jgi:hypothetical protein
MYDLAKKASSSINSNIKKSGITEVNKLGLIKKTDTDWEPYTGEYTVNTLDGSSGEYLTSPTGEFVRREFRTDNSFDPNYNVNKRQGASSSHFQIDHIVPLALGGEDTETNKKVLSIPDHDKKTKVGAVANQLYFNSKITLDEARKLSAIDWRDKDVAGITLNDKGEIDTDTALAKYNEWKTGTKADTAKAGVGLWGKIKSKLSDVGEAYVEKYPKHPLAEFVKGAASEMALGYLPAETAEYDYPRDQLIADIAKTAGQITGFIGSMALVYGIGGRLFGVASKIPKIGSVISKATEGAGIFSKIAPKASVLGKIKVSPDRVQRVLRDTGAFVARGQLAKQDQDTSRGKKFLEDLAWGGLSGVSGNTLKSYGTLAAGAYILSAAEDPDPKSALLNTALIVGLHGAMTPARNKLAQENATRWAKNFREGFGVIDDIAGKTEAEVAKTLNENTQKIVRQISKVAQSPEDRNALLTQAQNSLLQLKYNNLGQEMGLKEQIKDLKSVMERERALKDVYTSGYHPEAYKIAEDLNTVTKIRSNASKVQGGFDPAVNPTGEMNIVGTKANVTSNRDIKDYLSDGHDAAGDQVFLIVRDDVSMNNLMAKKGEINPQKNVQIVATDGEKVYSLGFLPRKAKVGEASVSAKSTGLKNVNEGLNAEDVYDAIKAKNGSTMTAEIVSAGGVKEGQLPWVSLRVGENDWKAADPINQFLKKKAYKDVFTTITKYRPTKSMQKEAAVKKEIETKMANEKIVAETPLSTMDVYVNGKLNVVTPASRKIEAVTPKEETGLFAANLRVLEDRTASALKDEKNAATLLGVKSTGTGETKAVEKFINDAKVSANGMSKATTDDMLAFYNKMKNAKVLDEEAVAAIQYLNSEKDILAKYASSMKRTPVFTVGKPAQPEVASIKKAMASVPKKEVSVKSVKEPKPVVSDETMNVETLKSTMEEKTPVVIFKKTPVVDRVKDVEPVIESKISVSPTTQRTRKIITPPKTKTDTDFLDLKERINVAPKKLSDATKLYSRLRAEYIENIEMVDPKKINDHINDILLKVKRDVNKSGRNMSQETKDNIVDRIKLELDEYKKYAKQIYSESSDTTVQKLNDDTMIAISKIFDDNGNLIRPVEVKVAKPGEKGYQTYSYYERERDLDFQKKYGALTKEAQDVAATIVVPGKKYVIIPEKASPSNVVQRTWESVIGEQPEKIDFGFSPNDNSLAIGLQRSALKSEGKLKYFYEKLLSKLDHYNNWLSKGKESRTWRKMKIDTANNPLLSITFRNKENDMEYMKAVRSGAYHKLPYIRAWEILKKSGADVGRYSEFYSNIAINKNKYPDVFITAKNDSDKMISALNKVEKEFPGKRINILFGKYPNNETFYDATHIIRRDMMDDLKKRMSSAGITSIKNSELPQIKRYLQTKDEAMLPSRISDAISIKPSRPKGKVKTSSLEKEEVGIVDSIPQSYSKRAEKELDDVEMSMAEWLFAPLEDTWSMSEKSIDGIADDIVPLLSMEAKKAAGIQKRNGNWFIGNKPLFTALLATLSTLGVASSQIEK